jgi:hypothetical protein
MDEYYPILFWFFGCIMPAGPWSKLQPEEAIALEVNNTIAQIKKDI